MGTPFPTRLRLAWTPSFYLSRQAKPAYIKVFLRKTLGAGLPAECNLSTLLCQVAWQSWVKKGFREWEL